jgi:hypothetical protein
MAAKQCKRSKVYRLKIEALHLQLATPQSIRSSKKMNSKNESIPCLLSRLHPCTPAPQLPCSALLRSSKKMNSKNESIPCPPPRFHPCTLAPQLPCSALLRSSKKTQKIFFYSKSYVNSARLANQHSPIIKSHPRPSVFIRVPYQPSNLQLIVPTPDHLIARAIVFNRHCLISQKAG